MARSKWKAPYINIDAIKNLFLKKTKKIYSRASTIPLLLLNKTIEVYNGKQFKAIKITRNKIGYKFGEFVQTRTTTKKKLKKTKKLKK